MKAPDKIYLHPDFEGSKTPSVFWSIEKRGSHPEECAEYIRKDALLEWAKELKGQVCSLHPNNRDASCVRVGMLTIIDKFFDKLNNF